MACVTAGSLCTAPRPGFRTLASPAVLRRDDPDAAELVFAGTVVHRDGSPVAHAVLTLEGVALKADERGSFELLLVGAAAAQQHLPVVVSSPQHASLVRRLWLLSPSDPGRSHLSTYDVAIEPGRLPDGTVVVLHDFVLDKTAA